MDYNMNPVKDKIDLNGKTILVTGSAGFIGANLVLRLMQDPRLMKTGHIISLDNINGYYDPKLKEYRLKLIEEASKASNVIHTFIKGSVADKTTVDKAFRQYRPNIVVNLAAQAGVRYSIKNPDAYISANIIGFYNILEACRHSHDGNSEGVLHLVYASSSSVYGENAKVPFSTDDPIDHPISLYAATKKSDELLAHCYSKLYDIPSTGLRFFTVYGPARRPDMAYYSFAEKLCSGESINVFNYGNCKRDFTYVDDIIEGVIRVMQGAPAKASGNDGLPVPPYSIYNIGGGKPESLMDFVYILAEELIFAGVLREGFNIESRLNLVPMQPGDVPVTYADSSGLELDYGFKPSIDLRTGLRRFAQWYKEYYGSNI